MVKISIIMKVDNAEKYLDDSLNCLLNQSFHDFELICIDNKSKDGSLSILKKYSRKLNHIKIVSLNNNTFPEAVNKSLKIVEGKYVFFMDAHNLLTNDALEKMYNKSETDTVDFLISNAYNENVLDYYLISKKNSKDKLNPIIKQTFNYTELKDLLFEFNTSLEFKLYNVDFLRKNNILLPTDVTFGQSVFFYNALLYANRIDYLNDSLFKEGSINVVSSMITNSNLLDSVDIANLILDVFKQHGVFEKYKKLLYNKKMDYLLNKLLRIDENYKEHYFSLLKNEFIRILNSNKECETFFNNLNYYNKKIYEQIIISENFYEFDLLHKSYLTQTDYYKIMDNNPLLKEYLDKKVVSCTK